MSGQEGIVYIVDDDSAMREALENLLASHGFAVQTFDCAAAYLGTKRPDVAACLILDVQLPDMSGLDLQTDVDKPGPTEPHPPIVFITGYGTISSSVRAMKAGAVDFLPKPFEPDALLRAVETALALDRTRREDARARARLHARYRLLTPREREVLPLVAGGLLNKQAAERLGISLVTLQIHRGKVMRKMGADSLADLVRMAAGLGIGTDIKRE